MNKNPFFIVFVLFWLGLGWTAIILTIAGIFYMPLLLIFALGGIIFSIRWLVKNKDLLKINNEILAVFIASIIFIIIFSYFTTVTIFSGRDQGALSEAAIRLAQNHRLEFSTSTSQEFFKIYGPGKALNFPGFSYTKNGQLVSQFSAGYVSWLAMFFSFFGLKGFVIANVVSFLIFALSFYLLAKEILPKKSAYVALGLILTSFVFSWFFKFTLSENLALALLWFGLWQFFLFIKNNQRYNFIFFLLSFGLLLFVRIETWAFLAVALLIIVVKHKGNVLKTIGKWPLFILAAIFFVYILNLLHNCAFLAEPVKGFLEPFISQNSSSEGNNSFSSESTYTLKILWNYSLIDYILFGLLGFWIVIKAKKFNLAIPFLIVLPSFIYLIDPNVSADHPWMLRRFVFSVIPVSILYTVYFIEIVLDKWRFLRYLFIVVFLAINLIVFIPYLAFSPHKTLLAQVEKISHNFAESDLVLVDRLATGDGWSMITGPMNLLFNKQAVYFFNLSDLDKIDLNKFSHVYFMIPDSNSSFYEKIYYKLIPQENYKIKNEILISKDTILPIPQKIETAGKIYLLKK